MKDNLKKYIDQQRESFDLENQDLDGLWLNISSRVQEKNKTNFFQSKVLWRTAAAILVFVGLSWLIIIRPINQNNTSISSIYSYSTELAEAEGYYTSIIDAKMHQINNYKDKIDPQIFEDIKALDNAMSELERDLKDNIDNEEVINAMIQNYRIKLEILEKIQSQLEEVENEKIES
jgi:hypothetical protein